MLLLDLDELDEVFASSRWWSTKPRSLARFRRADFLGDPHEPLDESVRLEVARQTGDYPQGPVRMLANLRYFGVIMNPISCYYCFDRDERLQYIVAEVTNTPWKERHCYVLHCDADAAMQFIEFEKEFHVSPFNPMAMRYHWRSDTPGSHLRIHMQNRQTVDGVDRNVFDASLVLRREEIKAGTLDRLLISYPLMTVKVMVAIYWEACKLFIKRAPFYSHPGSASGKPGV